MTLRVRTKPPFGTSLVSAPLTALSCAIKLAQKRKISAILFFGSILSGYKFTCSAQGSPPSAGMSGQQSVRSSAVPSLRIPAGGRQTQQRHGETVLGSIHSVFSPSACASLSAFKQAAVNKMAPKISFQQA